MQIFRAHLEYGVAVVVANDIIEAFRLLNNNDSIIGGVSITDIVAVEPFVVTGGIPAIITVYQE